jgi:adenosylhomocysteinase
MDMSFAIQALSAQYVAENHKKLEPGVIAVPKAIDQDVAFKKLAACGLSTPDQAKYLLSWDLESGT